MGLKEVLESRRVQFLIFLVITIAIIYLTIIYRTTMLGDAGFYEPDGFYHFSVIRAAVNNNFIVPHVLHISGYPSPTVVLEPEGLYWVTLFPYFFLQFFGISYYDVMRLVPVLFGIFDVIGAYLLSRMITKDKLFGILSMLFVALSMGDAARTSALIYRGDGFVTIFLIIALIFAALIMKEPSEEKHRHKISKIQFDKKKMAYAILSAVFLSLSNYVWNGAPFATAVFMIMMMLVIFASFIFDKKELLEDSKYLIAAFIIWYILVNIYISFGFFTRQTFTGVNNLSIIAIVVIGWFIAKYLSENAHKYKSVVGSPLSRFILAALIFAAAFAIIYVVDNSFIYAIFVGNGFIITSNFAATIQELQPPTQAFLYASFGNVLFITPMTIVMYLGTAATTISRAVIWIIMMFLMLPYLFMQVFDSGGYMKGKAKAVFGINPGMLILMAYFAATAYLQINAIRFNSLISVPLAIFGAYTVYWLLSFVRSSSKTQFKYTMVLLEILLIIGLVFSAANSIDMFSYISTFGLVPTIALFLVLALAYPAYLYYEANHHDKHEIHAKYATLAVGAVLLISFIIVLMYVGGIYANNLSQADNINPQFLSAMTWFKANSPANATVLTLWPDGSVVEGWANRTSVTDSVGSQNGSKADPFAVWLFNSSSDPQFLSSKINGKPGYFIARYTWMVETQGIYIESNLTTNASLYGSVLLDQFAENFNSTTELFQLSNSQGVDVVTSIPRNNSITDFKSYIIYKTLQTGQEEISPFSTVVLYNQDNANFSVIKPTYFNQTSGNMLVIMYSNVPRQGYPVNITGAYILSSYLANTNLAKFLFLCSSSACEWNNRNVSMQLIYANPDTKIFKIIYNNTANTVSALNGSSSMPVSTASNSSTSTKTSSANSITSNTVTVNSISSPTTNSTKSSASNSIAKNQTNATASKTTNSSTSN
jgi:asparagine N-glycosylation enzyme membrane subunit Stt3